MIDRLEKYLDRKAIEFNKQEINDIFLEFYFDDRINEQDFKKLKDYYQNSDLKNYIHEKVDDYCESWTNMNFLHLLHSLQN